MMEETKRGFSWFQRIGTFAFCFVMGMSASQAAQAASLYISPSTGSYAVGQSFTVNLYVSSKDQAENAVSGIVSFPSDQLTAVGISKSGSIVGLWVQEPSFSQAAGTVSFEGITLNPGYIGSAGKILSVTFKAKAAGTADVHFTSGSILANDGQGTNMLEGLGKATFNITEAGAKPPEPTPGKPAPTPAKPAAPAPAIPAPLISSPTHPLSNTWYANAHVILEWSLPAWVDGVSFLLDQKPTTDPGTVSQGRLSTTSFNDVKDGIWYFHLRFHGAAGWGPASHFQFKVLAQKPAVAAQNLALVFPYLTFLLLLLALYVLWVYFGYKKKVHSGVDTAQEQNRKEFRFLQDDIREEIRLLEEAKTRRQLTYTEKRVLSKLKKDAQIAEKNIQKKIRKIEK